MENVFQDLLKNNNSLLSRSKGDINILAEEGDNPLYGIFDKDLFFGYMGGEISQTGKWSPLIEIPSIYQFILVVKNSSENPDTLVKISNNSTDWEEVIGWQKASKVDSSLLNEGMIGTYVQAGYISSDSVYTTNIGFHDWTEGYISIEYAKTEDNSNGSSEKFNIIPVQDFTFLKNDIVYKEGLNALENFLQSSSNNNYTAKTWQDNEIIDLTTINKWENTAEQYGFNYIKQVWNNNDIITADKLNHLKNFYSRAGEIQEKDGIESVCIYSSPIPQSWGQHIFVDKNHDLSYYITGSDYVNEKNENEYEGDCINLEAKYGYEWGGYGTSTSITSQSIGDGLSNTNSLISKNLQPNTSGWRVLWDMVEEFRNSHSNDWFVPSLNELKEVYNQRSYLENLSTSTNPYYWTSSERVERNLDASSVVFDDGRIVGLHKYYRFIRSRLCWIL